MVGLAAGMSLLKVNSAEYPKMSATIVELKLNSFFIFTKTYKKNVYFTN